MDQEAPSSGRLYTLVTRYWPRIAVGVVLLGAVLGWVLDALTVGSGLEFYVFAWGATTGGLWFLFDRAESSISGVVYFFPTRTDVLDFSRSRVGPLLADK